MSKQKTEESAPSALDEFTESMDKPAPPVAARRGLDPELQAMAKIDRILADFSEEGVSRILVWLIDKKRFPTISVARRQQPVVPIPGVGE